MYSCENLIDDKTLNSSDIDISFVAVKWDRGSKNKLIPEKQMIRYNFLEVHLRLCETKFIKKQTCSTYDEAL